MGRKEGVRQASARGRRAKSSARARCEGRLQQQGNSRPFASSSRRRIVSLDLRTAAPLGIESCRFSSRRSIRQRQRRCRSVPTCAHKCCNRRREVVRVAAQPFANNVQLPFNQRLAPFAHDFGDRRAMNTKQLRIRFPAAPLRRDGTRFGIAAFSLFSKSYLLSFFPCQAM